MIGRHQSKLVEIAGGGGVWCGVVWCGVACARESQLVSMRIGVPVVRGGGVGFGAPQTSPKL